jgi:surfeit locus 1 family protein
VRDPAAIAAAKGLAQGKAQVAPFYVEQESPAPPGGLPQPGKLVVSLPDNHLQYALTWFGLAAVLAGSFIAWTLTSGGAKGEE